MQYWLYAELVSVGISVDETFVSALMQSEKQGPFKWKRWHISLPLDLGCISKCLLEKYFW